MKKNELLKKYNEELELKKNELELLEKLEKLDFNKFDRKTISKRITSYIKKELNLNEYDCWLDRSSYYIIYLMIRNEKIPYKRALMINLEKYESISGYDELNTNLLKDRISNYINVTKESILTLKQSIKNIDKIIKLYNNLVDIEKELSSLGGWIFRDYSNWHITSYYKIESEDN